jgi:uncharacterized membrane protein YiaA
MAHRTNVSDGGRDGRNPLLVVAGIVSGVACLMLVPALYGLSLFVSDRLFGSSAVQRMYDGGRMAAGEVSPRKWILGLWAAFMAGLVLLKAGKAHSRHRLSVRQYWAVTLFLVLLSLVASFLPPAIP